MPPRKRDTEAEQAEQAKAAECLIDGCTNTYDLTRGLCPAHWASQRGLAAPKEGGDG